MSWLAATRAPESRFPLTIGACAVLLSALLVVLLWLTYSTLGRASTTLAQGQAGAFMADAIHEFTTLGHPPNSDDLRRILAEHEAEGLRYLLLWRPETGALAEAGSPIQPLDDAAIRSIEDQKPRFVGDRVRIRLGPPNHPPVHEGMHPPRGYGPPPHRESAPGWGRPPDAPPGPPPHAMSPAGELPPPGGPGGQPPVFVLEFEPVGAARLQSYARLTLVVGLTVLPAVVIAALSLVYLVRRQREMAERVDHARRLAALGEMAAMIAHELRNPLTALKGHAQLLLRSLSQDRREEKAARVVGEAIRLETFLDDLLDFARRGEIDPKPVDPAQVLRDSAGAVDRGRIVVHSETAPPSWPLDAPRIQQALSNVLSNAVQLSPESTPVEAAVFAEAGRLVFEVRDRGPGIPPGEEDRIFEPFYSRRVRGTGLGLSLARRIVDQHHGEITAHNAPEGGAVFRISLEKV